MDRFSGLGRMLTLKLISGFCRPSCHTENLQLREWVREMAWTPCKHLTAPHTTPTRYCNKLTVTDFTCLACNISPRSARSSAFSPTNSKGAQKRDGERKQCHERPLRTKKKKIRTKLCCQRGRAKLTVVRRMWLAGCRQELLTFNTPYEWERRLVYTDCPFCYVTYRNFRRPPYIKVVKTAPPWGLPLYRNYDSW